jgi:hypothetical protein
MRRFATALVVLAAVGCLGGSVGCRRAAPAAVAVPVPERWVSEVLADITRWIAEGTGIDFTPGGVMISNGGVRKDARGNPHISYFQITVTYRNSEFTSERQDIPCSPDGFPTEEGNRRIREAVEEINDAIRAAR